MMTMAKAYKIPKKVAGLRVPRPIRKSKVLRMFLQSPQNRILASSMVIAAGAAAAAVLARHHSAAEQGGDAAENVGGLCKATTGAMARMVNRVTESLASSLRPSDEQDDSAKLPAAVPNKDTQDTVGLP
jgi:hypothetical protein